MLPFYTEGHQGDNFSVLKEFNSVSSHVCLCVHACVHACVCVHVPVCSEACTFTYVEILNFHKVSSLIASLLIEAGSLTEPRAYQFWLVWLALGMPLFLALY